MADEWAAAVAGMQARIEAVLDASDSRIVRVGRLTELVRELAVIAARRMIDARIPERAAAVTVPLTGDIVDELEDEELFP